MTTQENVPNVNANNVVSMDDMSAAYLLLSVQQGNNFTPHQDPTPGCSSTENTAKEDKMDIDKPVNSSSLEDDHHIASNSDTGQAQRNRKRTSTFVCDLCQAPLTSKLILRRHKKLVHSGEQKELCDVCGARFKSKRDLTLHRKKQHPDRWAKCGVCHTEFATTRAFNRHRRNAHTEKANLSCDVCHVKFQSMNALVFHRQQQHGDTLTTRGGVKKKNVMPKFDQKRSYCKSSSTHKDGLTLLSRAICTGDSYKSPSKSVKPQPKPKPATEDSYECPNGCGYRTRKCLDIICHERICRRKIR